MDASQIQTAFDDVFDQAIVFHGYADYLRDYDLYIYAAVAPSTGIPPLHLRYRFQHCVRATTTTAVRAEIWKESLDERLVDYRLGRDLDGFVWGVRWQALYPGIKLLPDSAEAARWSRDLGIPFHEATIETNGHNITLVFSDLVVDAVPVGHAPFVVSDDEPDPGSPASPKQTSLPPANWTRRKPSGARPPRRATAAPCRRSARCWQCAAATRRPSSGCVVLSTHACPVQSTTWG